ncbi:MAG TPA: hypothetical protein VHA53_01545, partial [Nitrolancea sp.]|nr:hypothetical protein [Nitrolancea sp.]
MMHEHPASIAEKILAGDASLPGDLAAQVATWSAAARSELVRQLLTEPAGRRWLRGALLAELAPAEAIDLAERLRSVVGDFAANRRDSTTAEVVRAVPFDTLLRDA